MRSLSTGIGVSGGLLLAVVMALGGPATARDRAAPEADEEEFVSLFDGKTLDGWEVGEGDKDLWKVAGGAIVGDSPGIDHNTFLAAPGKYGDFELRLEFRLRHGKGNSGVQFRSRRVPDSNEVSGYQADIGEQGWGKLYDESRRNRALATAPEKLKEVLKLDDWNTYEIRAEGDRVRLSINGFQTVDYREPDREIPREGIIALQIHSGPAMRVEFRKLRINKLGSR